MPDSFYGTIGPNNTGNPGNPNNMADSGDPNLIGILDQARRYAHPMRMLENQIRITHGDIREAEKDLEEFQKKTDGQNAYLRVLSSFWMVLALIVVGFILSVVITAQLIYLAAGVLVGIGEFLIFLVIFLIIILWNSAKLGTYLMIGAGILVAVAFLIYFAVLVFSLFAVFAFRNLLIGQAQKKLRERELLFPDLSSRIEQLQRELHKLEYERSGWQKRLEELKVRHAWLFHSIPEHHMREEGLAFLASALRDGRARNIEEAVALYERQLRLYQSVEMNGMNDINGMSGSAIVM